MDSRIDQYFKKKYGENYAQAKQDEYDDSLSRANTGNFIGNLGEVIAGQRVGGVDSHFDQIRADAKENTIGKIDKEKKEFASDYDLTRKMDEDSAKDAQTKQEQDVNSESSKIAQSLAVKMGMNPEQAKTLTAAKWKSYSPALEKMYDIEQKKLDRAESRALRADQFNEKKRTQQIKDQELSAQEAKQLGLYKTGKIAEDQYAKAVKDKDEYNPTGLGQWIDNSEWAPNALKNNKAIEAQAAMSSWVEAYLRDASGAAIPPSERMAYAKDFFPQPGDSDDVVANKAISRQQKMENARIAAGPKAHDVQPVQSPEDLAALKWANENPNDPRAKKILQKLNTVSKL